MKLADARSIVKEVSGHQYAWLKAWGLSTIREALRTIEYRASATKEDLQAVEEIRLVISRKW